MAPKAVSTGPCHEVVWKWDEIDLGRLPVQTCWPGEPAPLITWPLVVTQGPRPKGKGAERRDNFNLGIYRMQVTGSNTTLMRWLKHRGGAQQYTRWKGEKNAPMPRQARVTRASIIGMFMSSPIFECSFYYRPTATRIARKSGSQS